jgi:hypothetical protein
MVFTHDSIAPCRSLDRGVIARASWPKPDAFGARRGDRRLSAMVGCGRGSELSDGAFSSTPNFGEATPSGVISGAPVT